jgi:hypothetical protein
VTRKWGKAGERIDEQEARTRQSAAVARRNQDNAARAANDEIAHKLWRAGLLKPYIITFALNAKGLYGPEVDEACGAREPDVDLWEAGKLYPTWEQVLLLAALCGVTPRFLVQGGQMLKVSQTSLRFHGYEDDEEPVVWAFDPEAVAATVGTVQPV